MEDRKDCRPLARDEMSDEEFNRRMSIGLSQAKACEGDPVDVAIERLLLHSEILKGINQVNHGEVTDIDTALARIREKRTKAK